MNECKILIEGRPITKKNSPSFCSRNRKLLPSRQYQEYAKKAFWQIRSQYYGDPIRAAVHVKALYYMPNRAGWPDLLGLEQATADILQDSGVIVDDGFIESWDGSRIDGIDKSWPRAEITIRTMGKESKLGQMHPKLKGGDSNV